MKPVTRTMKPFILTTALLALLPLLTAAADKPAPTAKAVFIVSGMECGSCVYMVQHTLSQTRGIAEVEVLQTSESFARVSFDPKVISEHQIAQAVREAPGLHGMPYIAKMKLRVSGYAQNGNAAKVKELFDRWKPWIELVVWDEREGELHIHFHELNKESKKVAPSGWSLAQLTEALQAPAPKGLGLKFEIIEPGQL